jgi:hypothetical protein
MSLHPHQAGLLPLLDPAWRQRLWVSGLVLCIPLVGWPLVLGHRANFVRSLRDGSGPLLPTWRNRVREHLGHGLRAIAVIFGYLAPLYALFVGTAYARGYVPEPPVLAVAAAMLAFPIFATLSLPLACLHLATPAQPMLTTVECAAAIALYALVIFLVPAGFLVVSRTGRYRDAFALRWTLPFVRRRFADYCRAWWYSSWMSLSGHFALPVAPWGVAWCYLGIVALFNEVLWIDEGRPARGWLPRIVAAPRPTGGRAVDAAGSLVRVVDLGLFSAVLPGRPVR